MTSTPSTLRQVGQNVYLLVSKQCRIRSVDCLHSLKSVEVLEMFQDPTLNECWQQPEIYKLLNVIRRICTDNW